MGLYNFQARFAPRIRAWDADPEDPLAKAHTIRAPRKRHKSGKSREDVPGNTMYLYTGLRARPVRGVKQAARIVEPPPVCAKRESVVIMKGYPAGALPRVWIGPFLDDVLDDVQAQFRVINNPTGAGLEELNESERDLLARRDGFESFADMMSFWEGRLPFYGHIFHWKKPITRLDYILNSVEQQARRAHGLAEARS